jgi:hypothetical protein
VKPFSGEETVLQREKKLHLVDQAVLLANNEKPKYSVLQLQ